MGFSYQNCISQKKKNKTKQLCRVSLSYSWKKNGKGDEITTSLQSCDIGAREKLQCVWLSEVSTLAAECVNCKNNLEAKSENK